MILEVLWQIAGDNLRHITLEGIDQITPDILAYQITPYLQALRDIQQVYCDVKQIPYEELRIIEIHNEAPKIDILNAGETIRALNDVATPRKREQDAKIRDLQIQEQELKNIKLEDEILAHREQFAIEHDPNLTEAEREVKIGLLREELKQKQLETQSKEQDLKERQWQFDHMQMREYMAIAEELLKRWSPEPITLELIMEHAVKLARANKVIAESPLTMRLGTHDNPRPTNPPET